MKFVHIISLLLGISLFPFIGNADGETTPLVSVDNTGTQNSQLNTVGVELSPSVRYVMTTQQLADVPTEAEQSTAADHTVLTRNTVNPTVGDQTVLGTRNTMSPPVGYQTMLGTRNTMSPTFGDQTIHGTDSHLTAEQTNVDSGIAATINIVSTVPRDNTTSLYTNTNRGVTSTKYAPVTPDINTTQAAVVTTESSIIKTVQSDVDTTQSAINTTQSDGDTTQLGVDTTQSAINTTQLVVDTTQSAINTTQLAAGTTQSATNTTQSAADTMQSAINTTQLAADTTQLAADTTQSAINTTQLAADSTQLATDTTQSAINTTQLAADTTQSAINTTLAAIVASQFPKTTIQAIVDRSQLPINTTQVAVITTKTPVNTTQSHIDIPQTAVDTTQASVNTTQVAVDTTQTAVNTTQAAADTTHANNGLTVSDVVPDTTKAAQGTITEGAKKTSIIPEAQSTATPESSQKFASTSQTTQKSTKDILTPSPTQEILVPPSIDKDDLTTEQKEGTVTVGLETTLKHWEEKLWEDFVELIKELIVTARGKPRERSEEVDLTTDIGTDIPTATDVTSGTNAIVGTPEVIFIGDPSVEGENLLVSFIADDGTGTYIGSKELADWIRDNEDYLEAQLGVRISSIREGLPPEKRVDPVKATGDDESYFSKNAALFIALIVIACICLIIIIVGLVYILCARQRHEGQHYLHARDTEAGGIDNPAMTEKVNGAQPMLHSAVDDTEIVPYDNFTPEELNFDDVEDTHL
ncbi:uncharacterized protein LOC100368642 [Saccoglossus kowalevskii]|uniref:Mucin-22-like n=1 Tax=Saccoglossus kowalevskii TaxID=10224 RepID=A0ABM0GV80_SACKO|nr:PREDICTED: mucin-22-like [Saccoglossus kowalevskii]